MRTIDFVPATFDSAVQRERHIAFTFPCQPSFFEGWSDIESVPHYKGEIRIWNGRLIEEMPFPLTIENLWIQFASGGRGCFLPFGFRASGNVGITIETNGFEKRLLAVGDMVTMKLLRQVSGIVKPTYG